MPAHGFAGWCVRFLSVGVLIAFASYVAAAASCVQSSSSATTWENQPISTETSSFTAAFDATPSQADTDGVIGFSLGAATGYTSLAAIIRFNQSGTIDVRNGGSYTAAQSVPYSAGLTELPPNSARVRLRHPG